MHLKNNSMVGGQRFLVFRHPNFFSPILIIIGIRLKFRSTAHLECFKYPYWYMLFLAKIWLFWLQQGQFQYLVGGKFHWNEKFQKTKLKIYPKCFGHIPWIVLSCCTIYRHLSATAKPQKRKMMVYLAKRHNVMISIQV